MAERKHDTHRGYGSEAVRRLGNDIVMITHGDCKEDAEFVARQVEKKMGVHNILINCIGTVIGSHTGPWGCGCVLYGE